MPAEGLPGPGSLEGLLASTEIAIVCGAGGVGKTTTAAAIAAATALREGAKVLVLTVDPARRLAGALGLAGLGNDPRAVPAAAFGSGRRPRGELWAAMLDTKQGWDDLVRRHAPDHATVKRILENPLYQNISGRFVGSHDYIAMERLYELHEQSRYDLIVVDTPPSRNALDFIDAPGRMAEFFSSRLLRLLIVPYRSRMVNLATRPFYLMADRLLGSQFLGDIADFFLLFQTMYQGFVTRSRAVEALLGDRRSTFVVVSTPEPTPAGEAGHFVQALSAKGYHVGALVWNRTLPAALLDPALAARAEALTDRARELAGAAGVEGADPEQVARVLREVGENFRNFAVLAGREASQRRTWRQVPDVVASVPQFERDIYDLEGLLRLGDALWVSDRALGESDGHAG